MDNNQTPNEKKVNQVVTGKVKVKKKGVFKKFKDEFIMEDASKVKTYIWKEVIVPCAKKLFAEITSTATDLFLYGDARSSKKQSNISRISYNGYYNQNMPIRRQNAQAYDGEKNTLLDDYIIDSRSEAEAVISQMEEIISQYGMVSVFDYKEMIGVRAKYTDNNYGWTDIRASSVDRTRDGYVINFPTIKVLK